MDFVRLGLKWRVYCGFGFLVLVGLVLSGFATWKLLSIKTDTQNLSAINDNTIRTLEIAHQIEIIRRANLRYIVDADEQAIMNAAKAESSATGLLKDAAVATLSEERREIYNSLRSDVDSMRAKRDTLVGLGTQMVTLRAALFTDGDDLTAATDRLVQSGAAITDRNIATLFESVETSALRLRVANWRFLATRDPAGPGIFKANAERAVAIVAALDKVELPVSIRVLVGSVKALLTAYISNFDALAASQLKSDELYWQSIVPQTTDMQAKIDKALASLKQASGTTKSETFAAIGEITATHEVVAVLVLVLGSLIAWLISRSIIRPVTGMTTAMGRLAAGDDAVEIPSRNTGDEIGAMANAVEVFRQTAIAWKKADRRIRLMAHHNVLTSSTNRARLIEMLEDALRTLASGGSFGLHFVDIDRFKEVNDSFGHDAGDFVLTSVAARLRSVARSDDVVARIGGDEFIVVQGDVHTADEAEAFAQRLAAALAPPVRFGDRDIITTASIGVAIAPEDGKSPERLLKSADLALYRSKTDGRNCIRRFVPEMDAEMQTRIEIERLIRHAVATSGFELHFQPLFELSNRQLIGFEALIRLPRGDGTLIPPATFIPLAEDMGLIDTIGTWVLQEACRTAMTWPNHLTVAVNLSPLQFDTSSISEVVASALKTTGLEPHRLELEITATVLLRDSEAVIVELQKLKTMGVSIAMDDFGTGYSSLSYLWRFPFDIIKIDGSFMSAFDGSHQEAETVVKSVIALARELKMRVTVEGIETAQQAAFLDGANGDRAQGFYFGRPVPASELAAGILTDFRKITAKDPLLSRAEGNLRVLK